MNKHQKKQNMKEGTKEEAIKIIMKLLSNHIENTNERYVLANFILKDIEYEKLLKDSIDLSWTNNPERMGR